MGKIVKFLTIIILILGLYLENKSITSKYPNQQPVESSNIPELKKVESKYVVFYTDAFLPKKDNSIVKFPYKFDIPHQELWLSVQVNPDSPPIIILVDHPIFANLDWQSITDGDLTLFQKNKKFDSIDQFLYSPPSKEKVIADPHLIYDLKIVEGVNFVPLINWTGSYDFDYFLTTYKPSQERNGYLYFESKVDLTHAMITPCVDTESCKERITWKLDMPNGGEKNPLHIGTVHLDQRQW